MDIESALARFEEFGRCLDPHEVIDEDSGLSGADVSLILETAKRGANVVSIRQIDFRNPLPPDLL